LVFPIVLKYAAAEITCAVYGALSLDFEVQEVKTINETVSRHQSKLGIIIVERQRGDEGRRRFISRETFQGIGGINEKVLLFHYN
jgi:hypothetical protein